MTVPWKGGLLTTVTESFKYLRHKLTFSALPLGVEKAAHSPQMEEALALPL